MFTSEIVKVSFTSIVATYPMFSPISEIVMGRLLAAYSLQV
jgi:hypothetical protein